MNAISSTSKIILGAALMAAMLGACKRNDTAVVPNDATTTSPSTTSGTSGTNGNNGAGAGGGTTAPKDTPYTAPSPAPMPAPDTMPPSTPTTPDGRSGTGTTTPPR